MENKEMQKIANSLVTEINETQKMSINTNELTQQVLLLSNADSYTHLEKIIIEDPDMDATKKVALFKELNDDFEHKIVNSAKIIEELQTTQTKNITFSAQKLCGCIVLGAVSIIIVYGIFHSNIPKSILSATNNLQIA